MKGGLTPGKVLCSLFGLIGADWDNMKLLKRDPCRWRDERRRWVGLTVGIGEGCVCVFVCISSGKSCVKCVCALVKVCMWVMRSKRIWLEAGWSTKCRLDLWGTWDGGHSSHIQHTVMDVCSDFLLSVHLPGIFLFLFPTLPSLNFLVLFCEGIVCF